MAKKPQKQPNPPPPDPETEQKIHLRSLAISKNLLRKSPANPSSILSPSKSVLKLDGHDIVKRGQRKSRYLFSFPGLLAPLSAGRIGELADLGTKNPVLYLDFPQGRVKLMGTHVYPKNKYLTLQLTKSAKGVMCEDCFESLIVFSESWWIGTKEENPEENQLDFPKDFSEAKHADCDFKGGAGATVEEAASANKAVKKLKDPLTPETDLEDDSPEDFYPSTGKTKENTLEVTPARQSTRVAGKSLNYAESSSGNDSVSSDAEAPEEMEFQIDATNDKASRRSIFGKMEGSNPTTSSVDPPSELVDTEKIELSSSLNISKENPPNKKGRLVQTTLSSMFENTREKRPKRSSNQSPGPKGSGGKRQQVDSKQLTDQEQVKGSNKKVARSSAKKTDAGSGGRKTGTRTVSVKKQSQVAKVADDQPEEISSDAQVGKIADDEPEEISSDPQDDSDSDWAA